MSEPTEPTDTPWLKQLDDGFLLTVKVGPSTATKLQAVTGENGPQSAVHNAVDLLWAAQHRNAELRRYAALRNSSPLGRRNPWTGIPIDIRKTILEDLRARPFPWLGAHKELAKKHGVKSSSLVSLIQCIALFGFDDHNLNTYGLEEPGDEALADG